MFDLEVLKGDGSGIGTSPNVGVSGAAGEGTKTVFLTSLLPRLTVGLRGVTTCYIHMSIIYDDGYCED